MTHEEFMKLSQAEINIIPDDEWKKLSSEVKHSCEGCDWLKGYVSLWCTNDACASSRGTHIPGVIKCSFWKKKRTTIEKIKEFFMKKETNNEIPCTKRNPVP